MNAYYSAKNTKKKLELDVEQQAMERLTSDSGDSCFIMHAIFNPPDGGSEDRPTPMSPV